MTMRNPPRKKPGDAKAPRRFNGALMDVSQTATFLGVSEGVVRARVDRRLLPYRRFGRRIVFLKTELEWFLTSLPGCSLKEAKENLDIRGGHE